MLRAGWLTGLHMIGSCLCDLYYMRCTFHDKPRSEWVDEKLSAGSCALLCAASAMVSNNKHAVNSGSQYLRVLCDLRVVLLCWLRRSDRKPSAIAHRWQDRAEEHATQRSTAWLSIAQQRTPGLEPTQRYLLWLPEAPFQAAESSRVQCQSCLQPDLTSCSLACTLHPPHNL